MAKRRVGPVGPHRGSYHVSVVRPLWGADSRYRRTEKIERLFEYDQIRLLARHDHTYDKTSSSVRALHDHNYCHIKGVRVAPRRIPYSTGLPQDLACHTKLAMYSCPSCPYTSDFVTSMRLHRFHLHCNLQFAECLDYKETCYVCDLCSFHTYSLLFSLEHDCPKTYGFTSWYCCSLCDFKSSLSQALQEHQSKTHFSVFVPLKFQYGQAEVHLGNQRHVNVQHCKNGTSKGKCKKETVLRRANGLWKCPLCEFKVDDKATMIGHFRAHTELSVSWFQCGRCKFKTKRDQFIKKHRCDTRVLEPRIL